MGGSSPHRVGRLPPGGVFPGGLVVRAHQPEGELYYLLRQFYTRSPEVFRRAQVLVDVDNQSVVGSFNRGRARNRETMRVQYDFMPSLRWVPTEENGVADAISRPSREATVRISPAAFEHVWGELGPFVIDLMACTASALRHPGSQEPLPFFPRHDCPGSAGVDVLAQDV